MSDDAPLCTFFARAFQIDPNTKKKWIPLFDQSVNVSFHYDTSKFIYKIFSAINGDVLINSTITSGMSFTKTSQKFGQWSDAKLNTMFGLGFTSENDLVKFSDKFNEYKMHVCNGTSPSYSNGSSSVFSNGVSPPHSKIINNSPLSVSLSASQSGSIISSGSTGSNEEGRRSPHSRHSSNSFNESNLKYENDRLKKALAQSSVNAKKWEAELQTLKNNNARLTAALQESLINVEKWKEQLHNYKEENTKLRKMVATGIESNEGYFSSVRGVSSSSNHKMLEQSFKEAQEKLRKRDEEIKQLSHCEELNSQQLKDNEFDKKQLKDNEFDKKIKSLQEENAMLKEQTNLLRLRENQLMQISEVKGDIDKKLLELNSLHQKMASFFNS
ncbi:homer protein homolog 2 isoform X4 [Hydra vulgaris]|uniref:Homer protein homolog 2 isoform X4 n=1 Tax=Hydra vulgaris TaxID=6087 RepID=A0ABM4DDF9_HYDVU